MTNPSMHSKCEHAKHGGAARQAAYDLRSNDLFGEQPYALCLPMVTAGGAVEMQAALFEYHSA